ncbi:RiPP maturation radical SAM C-methyltransferase [Actinomadura fulvescens]|uniref:RiPP maturation radical SAM C-methyltransferase n=1 Tax=Actinomadura fulvescens TaxID=46160 RepID=A0ABN3PFU7_9ACTN
MYDVRLINMPFASLQMPSLALTQLASMARREFGDVSVRVHYLNHDFAKVFGVGNYQQLCYGKDHQASGIGEWIFRLAAFDTGDNRERYFRRYYPTPTPEWDEFRAYIQGVRDRIPECLDELIDRYGLLEADLVGFTSMFQQNVPSFAMARRIKERDPSVVTVIGGANCEAPMGQEIARNIPQIDYVFSGCALRSFPDLLAALRDGDVARAGRIGGVFTEHNLEVVVPRGPELDVNADIELDFDGFLADLEANFPGGAVAPVLPFETSRGCWWGEHAHCTFCGLNGDLMRFRSMRPDKAIELFRSLFERYGAATRMFMCADNIMPREYPAEVFPHVRAPDDVSVFYEVKADLTRAELAAMAAAGVRIVQPGIESLATSTLRHMRKGVSAFRNLQFLRSCVLTNVKPIWNLLIGFPGEPGSVYEKYLADMPSLWHLRPPAGLYVVRFDRYSPYFKSPDEYGLDLAPMEYYRQIYPLGDDVLRDLAYYFYDRNDVQPYPRNVASWVDKLSSAVLDWRQAWEGRERPPVLFLDRCGDGGAVIDTRGGEETRQTVDEAECALLSRLAEPKRLDRPAQRGPDVVRLLTRFRERGWLFEEGQRVLSLVFLEAPPGWETGRSRWDRSGSG